MARSPDRLKIPASVSRDLLIESGHRCAVCGVPCPLERAHIIPWSKVKEHRVENLICLCANCHERADREGWGFLVLQKYKLRPWVMRQNGAASPPSITKQVTIVIEKSFSEFDAHNEEILRHALASFLQISIDSIGIIGKREGSIQVLLELPAGAVDRLLEAFKMGDPRLSEHLPIFPLRDVRLKSDRIISSETQPAEDQMMERSSTLEASGEANVRSDYESRFERVVEDRCTVVLLFFTKKGLGAEAVRDLTEETFLRLYSIGFSSSEQELDTLIFKIAREVYRANYGKKGNRTGERARERESIKAALEDLPSQMRQLVFLFVSRLMDRKH